MSLVTLLGGKNGGREPRADCGLDAFSNLYFRPLTEELPLAVRQVRGAHLGKLITVRAIVTRVSEVKPLLQVNAYTCDSCGSEIFQDVDSRKITPLNECVSEVCVQNNSRGQLHMQTRASKFVPFQEAKVQEMVSPRLVSRRVSFPVCLGLTRRLLSL